MKFMNCFKTIGLVMFTSLTYLGIADSTTSEAGEEDSSDQPILQLTIKFGTVFWRPRCGRMDTWKYGMKKKTKPSWTRPTTWFQILHLQTVYGRSEISLLDKRFFFYNAFTVILKNSDKRKYQGLRKRLKSTICQYTIWWLRNNIKTFINRIRNQL
jgi:hypothetical protein